MSSHKCNNFTTRVFVISASAIAMTSGQASAGSPPGPASTKTMNVNGAELTYQEQGQGSPVVFLHPALADRGIWEDQRQAIAANHHFIAPTMRYFGSAAWPDGGQNFSVAKLSDDVAAFIQGLHEGPVTLVSWSFSGPISLLVATRHPEFVRGLFLFEPTDASFVADPAQSRAANQAYDIMMAPVIGALRDGGPAAAAKAVPGAVSGHPGLFETFPAGDQANILAMSRTMPLMLATPRDSTVTCEQLGQLKIPVVVSRGEDTLPFWKITTNAAARCIPGAELVVFPNVGHFGPVADAARMSAEVLELADSK